MKKNVLSVRMYDTTFDKLRQLEYLEKEKEKKYKEVALTKSEIVEDAIAHYYAMKLDKDTGTYYLVRMNLMIQDALKQQNHSVDLILNQILRFTMMSYEAGITILKDHRLSENEQPKNTLEAEDLIQNIESIFEEGIHAKIAMQLGESGDE